MNKDSVVYSVVREDKVFRKIEDGVRKWAVLSDIEPEVVKSIKPGATLLMESKNGNKLLGAKILEAEKMNIYGMTAFMVRFGRVKVVIENER